MKWAPGHSRTVLSRLKTHVFPLLGARAIVDLDTFDLMQPLEAIKKRGTIDVVFENYKGRTLTRLTVMLSLHVFVRSSELRFARWNEFDLKRGIWEMSWWSRYLEANRQEHISPHEFANQIGANVSSLRVRRGAVE